MIIVLYRQPENWCTHIIHDYIQGNESVHNIVTISSTSGKLSSISHHTCDITLIITLLHFASWQVIIALILVGFIQCHVCDIWNELPTLHLLPFIINLHTELIRQPMEMMTQSVSKKCQLVSCTVRCVNIRDL